MLGPVFFVIILFVVITMLKRLMMLMMKRCGQSPNCFAKRVFRVVEYRTVITRFLLETCVEIGISATICLSMVEKASFENFWEAFMTSTAGVSILCLIVAPIYHIRITRVYLNDIQNAPTVPSKHE